MAGRRTGGNLIQGRVTMTEDNPAGTDAGQTDPNDLNAQEAAALVAQSDAREAERLKALEAAGKARVTVLDAEPAPPPTAPTPETLAALGLPQVTDTEAEAEDPDALQVGDVLDADETEADPTIPEGYGQVVVSTDGLPTEATEAAEAAKAEQPVVVG